MITQLSRVSVIVRDQDEALQWYTEKLRLEKREDQEFAPGMRWLTVATPGQSDVEIVLFKPGPMQSPEDAKTLDGRVGQGPTWVFNTDDCRKDAALLKSRGVKLTGEPEEVPWGVQALFEDLYGNPYVLLEPRPYQPA